MIPLTDFRRMSRKGDTFVLPRQGEAPLIIEESFPQSEWDCPEAFKMAGIRGYEPMTAKELDTEESQDARLRDSSYILEEKFDGTRALVYFLCQEDVSDNEIGFCRVFSRRVSKKTGFYVENTDSLPQIKEIDVPALDGTILDGEMFINGLPFREVSSTLNCLWDKAIERQIEKGFISFHAFDILYYKGIDLRRLPLERRKVYLHLAVTEANSPYIEEVVYFDCGDTINSDVYTEVLCRIDPLDEDVYFDHLDKNIYPHLYDCWKNNKPLTPRAYYEIIVSTGGEGLIVKPKRGKYLHKRGWEYSKIKKFLTRELVVLGFEPPTREYTGKDIRKWAYWERNSDHKKLQGNFYGDKAYTPVTKHYFFNQVGTICLGVVISDEEYGKLPKNKQGVLYSGESVGVSLPESKNFMLVCECSGFDDDTREYFTRKQNELLGSVIEVKANELMRDSGRMRHPRYLRMRFDKEPERCTWSDHIGSSAVTS